MPQFFQSQAVFETLDGVWDKNSAIDIKGRCTGKANGACLCADVFELRTIDMLFQVVPETLLLLGDFLG